MSELGCGGGGGGGVRGFETGFSLCFWEGGGGGLLGVGF